MLAALALAAAAARVHLLAASARPARLLVPVATPARPANAPAHRASAQAAIRVRQVSAQPAPTRPVPRLRPTRYAPAQPSPTA